MSGASASSFDRQVTVAGAIATAWKVEGAADFNGDGNDDVLMRHQTTGAREIRFMRGSEVIQTSGLLAVGMNYQVAGLADLDGDKKADIVWRDPFLNLELLGYNMANC